MTNALFYLFAYAHWLIVFAIVLLILGFVGLALFGQTHAEDDETSSGDEQRKFEAESDPDLTKAADRNAKLTELKDERWAE